MTYQKTHNGYSMIFGEPDSVYHNQENRQKYLSSGRLKEFRNCPLLYRQKVLGVVSDREESEALKIGSAAHKMILEGQDAYDAAYCFGGPVNPKTNKPFGPDTKKFREWERGQGKPCLSNEQDRLVHKLAGAVRRHEGAADLLNEGIPEVVIRGKRLGVDCQIRIDWLSAVEGFLPVRLVDLKTCADLASLEGSIRAERRALERGYPVGGDKPQYIAQLAFYRDILSRALEISAGDVDVSIVAVEKKAPYRVGVFHLSQQSLGLGEQVNRQAMERFLKSTQNDTWPTGYEGGIEI